MAKPNSFRFLAAILALLMLAGCFGITAAAEEADLASDGSEKTEDEHEVGTLEDILKADGYSDYLISHSLDKAGEDSFVIDVTDYSKENTTAADVQTFGELNGEDNVILLPASGAVGWKFTVKTAGMYTFRLKYYTEGGKKTSVERTMYLDDEIPYYESIYLTMQKTYYNVYEQTEDGIGFKTDLNGNELRPECELTSAWREYTFSDSTGYYIDPLSYYLSAGEHLLQLYAQREAVYITDLEIIPFNPADEHGYYTTYEEYVAAYEGKGAKDVALDEPIVLQAEKSYRTSESTIYPSNDRTSSITMPQHSAHQLMNTLGGGTEKKWNTVGQWVSYEVTVPESGFYKIVLRFNQNESDGSFVSRKLRVKLASEEFATIPFAEANYLQFKYADTWQTRYLNDGTTDFRIYLEKGTNQVEFEANLGGMSDLIRRVNDSLTNINDAYIKIIMLAGTDPDANRDYGFYARIPEAVDELLIQSKVLYTIADEMHELIGTNGSQITTLRTVAQLLEKMGSDEDEIAKNLGTLKSYLGNLGTWINDARKSPLEIDYLQIASGAADEKALPAADANFWQKLVFEVQNFISSFTTDYNTLGALEEIDADRSIQVWISLGRDQAQIVRQLVAYDFTPTFGIPVNLKLVAGGSLLPSVLAGVGPDVSLGHGTGDVINWAIRNALIELTDFVEEDGYLCDKDGKQLYDTPVYDWFSESAWIPLTLQEVITEESYNDLDDEEKATYTTDYESTDPSDKGYAQRSSIWGMPQEQSFNMMFYRADIFLELGLEPPKTWDDLYYIIGVLQSNNMEIALPTSLGGLEMFLYQMGGDLYKNGGQQISLNENVTLSAFETLCEFFQQYKFPIAYSFENRFRTGEIPIGIVPYTSYTSLAIYATEIKGLWEFVPMPGILNEDGSVNNNSVSGTSAMIMLKTAADRGLTKDAWTFMKWFVSAGAQSDYASDLTAVLGAEYKYNTANVTALEELPWTESEATNLASQFEHLSAVKEYPGSYIIGRYVNFSFLDVYNNNSDPVQALLEYVVAINSELTRKRSEFGLATMEVSYSI